MEAPNNNNLSLANQQGSPRESSGHKLILNHRVESLVSLANLLLASNLVLFRLLHLSANNQLSKLLQFLGNSRHSRMLPLLANSQHNRTPLQHQGQGKDSSVQTLKLQQVSGKMLHHLSNPS